MQQASCSILSLFSPQSGEATVCFEELISIQIFATLETPKFSQQEITQTIVKSFAKRLPVNFRQEHTIQYLISYLNHELIIRKAQSILKQSQNNPIRQTGKCDYR